MCDWPAVLVHGLPCIPVVPSVPRPRGAFSDVSYLLLWNSPSAVCLHRTAPCRTPGVVLSGL